MIHVNVYGPAASGKTRYADKIAKKYGCTNIIDEGKLPPGAISLPRKGRSLILTQRKIVADGIATVHISEALK